MQETLAVMQESLDGDLMDERMRAWLDDLMALCDFLFASVISSPIQQAHIRSLLISLALEFCWKKSLSFNGKIYKIWSGLRPALLDFGGNMAAP
eukprot:9462923-Karenia_brevis.AAC.1